MNILSPANPASPLNQLHNASSPHDSVSSGSAMIMTIDMIDVASFICSLCIYVLIFAIGVWIGRWSMQKND